MIEQDIQSWIGRSRTSQDEMRLEQAALLDASLLHEKHLKNGDPLPPLWHWIYFQEPSSIKELGRDGHAAKGEFLPPVDLPRRMWAGGRVYYTRHPNLGETVIRRSTIKNIVFKNGKSGPLCFVTVMHEHTDHNGVHLFTEEHDIVYREDPKEKPAELSKIESPRSAVKTEEITPSPVLLFRYSALTFNSHRIHYDRDYCTQVEGYPGLVFHGPLTATLLADFARRQNPEKALRSFSFRATAPLFDTQPFHIKTDGQSAYWAETLEGGLAMEAEVVFE